ncbi:MAG: hypothetical protein ACREXP_09610, partial [Steroidobacteraceae bacterium]
ATADEQRRILDGYEEMGRQMRDARPDVIVGVSNDHMLNMPLKNPADFCIGTAASWSGPAEFFRDWLKLPEYRVAGHPQTATAILARMKDAGVRVMHSADLLFDDNWSVPLHFLTPGHDIPLVPIHMNCINPPIPGPERSFAAGEELARSLREDLPDSLRVAVIGTGGLSHEPGGKRYFNVDEAFDRWFLDLLATGDVQRIVREATVERLEAAGGGGTAELLAWIVAMASASDRRARTVFYVPSIEMRCGVGGVAWDRAA